MNSRSRVLYLVRHAKSSWKDSSLSDKERPLNKRGRRNAPVMGRRLAEQIQVPDLVISSPANRARTTAGIICKALGIDDTEILINDQLYFSGSRGALGALEMVEDQYHRVMLVGHNPTWTHLLNTLANTEIWNMPTCAVGVIGFDMNSWKEVRHTAGELLGYGYPKGPDSFST